MGGSENGDVSVMMSAKTENEEVTIEDALSMKVATRRASGIKLFYFAFFA